MFNIKTSLFSGICEIIKLANPLFFAGPKEGRFFQQKAKITGKETREYLVQFSLTCELIKVIRHFYDIVIENIGVLCGEELGELPYWETINNY